jgi:hypothetical protein
MSETTASDGGVGRFRHVKIRAWERYRLDLSNADCEALCSAFREKRTLFCGRGKSEGTSVHVAKIKGQHVRCVFSEGDGHIVTLLPWGVLKEPGKTIKAPRLRKRRPRDKKVREWNDDTDM